MIFIILFFILNIFDLVSSSAYFLCFSGAREVDPRMYPDDQRPDRCGIRAFLKYQSKKPAAARGQDYKLFVNCKTMKEVNWDNVPVWYSSQNMGVDNIGKLVAEQVKSIGVDTKAEKISSTSVR